MRTRIPLEHNSSSIHYFISERPTTRPAVKRWDVHPQFKLTLPPPGGMRNPGTDLVTYIAADGAVVYRPE